ncbi:MAG: 4,5-dioxygenase, partial [Proteobacteria bacterium]|nr:4,5-dioxygenase [Pseudomonadota bacterium]
MEDISEIKGYHAHVYFEPGETREKAERLMALAEAHLTETTVGGWNDEGRGPHPAANFFVSFMCDQYPNVVPWLSLNRDGLSVLVHPMTGDAP